MWRVAKCLSMCSSYSSTIACKGAMFVGRLFVFFIYICIDGVLSSLYITEVTFQYFVVHKLTILLYLYTSGYD